MAVSRVALPEWSKQRTCCLAVRQRLNGPGEEVTRRSLTQRAGITERRLAVQEQLAYRTVCMLQRHNVSSGVSTRAEEAASVRVAEDGHCFNSGPAGFFSSARPPRSNVRARVGVKKFSKS